MIKINNKEIIEIHWQNKIISEAYVGNLLIWLSEIKSCFANGLWIDNYPWTEEHPWLDNK